MFGHDNAVQAVYSHYNVEQTYDNLLSPIADTLNRRFTIAVAAGTGLEIAFTIGLGRHQRKAAQKNEVQQRMHNARQRRAEEFDTVKSKLMCNSITECRTNR